MSMLIINFTRAHQHPHRQIWSEKQGWSRTQWAVKAVTWNTELTSPVFPLNPWHHHKHLGKMPIAVGGGCWTYGKSINHSPYNYSQDLHDKLHKRLASVTYGSTRICSLRALSADCAGTQSHPFIPVFHNADSMLQHWRQGAATETNSPQDLRSFTHTKCRRVIHNESVTQGSAVSVSKTDKG